MDSRITSASPSLLSVFDEALYLDFVPKNLLSEIIVHNAF